MRTQILSKPKLSFLGKQRSLLQRKCDHCKKKGLLQRRAVSQSDPDAVPPIVHEVLRLPGQPLDIKTRASMETRFGYDFSRTPLHSMNHQDSNLNLKIGSPNDVHEQDAQKTADRITQPRNAERNPLFRSNLDFSQVRVHTDSTAADSAGVINALAYTAGSHIVFGSGEYSPGTDAGQKLLAHELAHVVQQTSLGQSPIVDKMIQRIEIRDCFDQLHEDWIRYEHDLAYKMLSYAYSMGFWNSDPRVQAAFWRHFKIIPQNPDFQDLWYQALWAMYAMLQSSPGAVYECESDTTSWWCPWGCGKKALAITYSIFTICPKWWDALRTTSYEVAASILIHEWAHKWVPNIRMSSETYCFASGYEDLPSWERLRQPDAYRNFAMELWRNQENICFNK